MAGTEQLTKNVFLVNIFYRSVRTYRMANNYHTVATKVDLIATKSDPADRCQSLVSLAEELPHCLTVTKVALITGSMYASARLSLNAPVIQCCPVMRIEQRTLAYVITTR